MLTDQEIEENKKYYKEYIENKKKEYTNKYNNELCGHMKKAIFYLEGIDVKFGGCGECGSAWLTCGTCNETVDCAHEVFERNG